MQYITLTKIRNITEYRMSPNTFRSDLSKVQEQVFQLKKTKQKKTKNNLLTLIVSYEKRSCLIRNNKERQNKTKKVKDQEIDKDDNGTNNSNDDYNNNENRK